VHIRNRALTNTTPKISKSVVVQQVAGTFLVMGKIFARILPNLTKKKLRPPKKSSCSFESRCEPFLLIFSGFSQIFRDFVKVFRDFAQISTDFHKIKTFGGALAPCIPASYTNGAA